METGTKQTVDAHCKVGFETGKMSVGQSDRHYKSSDKALGQNEK